MARANGINLAQVISVALFASVVGGAWDVWWHGFLGRESFWSPPHLLLYAGALVSIITSFYAWYIYKDRVWRRIALALLLVPLSAPFDELWHRTFGVEEVASVLVLWSPPHVLLILATMLSFAFILPVLKADEDVLKVRLFSSISIAGIAALLFVLITPLDPVGPWHVLGFWGAGFFAFVTILVLYFSRRWLGGVGAAITVAFPALTILAIGFIETTSDSTVPLSFPEHAHVPGWLIVLSVLVPAFLIDVLRRPSWYIAAIAGLISGGLWYGTATLFIENGFRYGMDEVWVVLLASLLGGLVAGFVIDGSLNNRVTSPDENNV